MEDTKQDKISTTVHIILNLQKIKDKQKTLKEVKGTQILFTEKPGYKFIRLFFKKHTGKKRIE
jgi:phage antirepressor YoqD-like protein